MICEKYAALSIKEKIELIGKTAHLVQNSNTAFDKICNMINIAEQSGLFDDVKFGADVELTIEKEVD